LRQGDLWHVRCGEREASGPQLRDVMAEATGHGGGDLVPLRPGSDTTLAEWLTDQAQTIEREYEALTSEQAADERRASGSQ
jgi:hypothetical protein